MLIDSKNYCNSSPALNTTPKPFNVFICIALYLKWQYLPKIFIRTRKNVKTLYSNFIGFCLFVCLLSHSRIFHSYGVVTVAGEELRILTYARQLSSEGSLACHTYCDKGHPFIMVISEDPWHSHLLPSVSSGAVTTCFCDLSRLGLEHSTFRLRNQRSYPPRLMLLMKQYFSLMYFDFWLSFF